MATCSCEVKKCGCDEQNVIQKTTTKLPLISNSDLKKEPAMPPNGIHAYLTTENIDIAFILLELHLV